MDKETIYSQNVIRDRIKPIMQKHCVEQAILFGSFARGTNDNRSDIDLLIIMDTAKRFLDRIKDFEELYDVLPGMALDLLVYNPLELQNINHRPFIRQILSEGICLYEQRKK
jgi:predicted nucleotidyltransferase